MRGFDNNRLSLSRIAFELTHLNLEPYWCYKSEVGGIVLAEAWEEVEPNLLQGQLQLLHPWSPPELQRHLLHRWLKIALQQVVVDCLPFCRFLSPSLSLLKSQLKFVSRSVFLLSFVFFFPPLTPLRRSMRPCYLDSIIFVVFVDRIVRSLLCCSSIVFFTWN